MPRNETRSSQFGLISGAQQVNSDLLLIAEPAALFTPEARKGHLYIITETTSDAMRGRDACQLVARTIRKVFYEDTSYSVTSALRKALSAANKALYQHNFNTVPQKRAMVGVTCAVVKEKDLYLAQVLPSQAYLLTNNKLRAFPTSPSWNTGQNIASPLMRPNAVGATLSIEPEFYRAVMQPGDSLLLCSSNLSRMLGREETQRMLQASQPDPIIGALLELCKRNALADAHGVAICVVPPLSAEAQAAPLSRNGMSERGRLLMRSVSGNINRLTGEIALLFKGSGERERQRKVETRMERDRREVERLQELPEEPPPVPMSLPPTPPLELGETLDERVEQQMQARRSGLGAPPARPSDSGLPPSAFLGEGEYQPPPLADRRIDLSDTAGMAAVGGGVRRPTNAIPSLEPTLGERIARPFEQAANTLTGMNRRRRLQRPPPSAMPQRRSQGLSYRREGPPFPWLLLVSLVLLVTLLIIYGRSLVVQTARDEANAVLASAEQKVEAIRSAPDEQTARVLLADAEQALEEVRASDIITTTQENRVKLELLQRDYERHLAEIRRLTYFDDLTEIGRHPQAAANATFSQIVVPPPATSITNTSGFDSIYALDSNLGILYRMPHGGGTPEPLLGPTDTTGTGASAGQVRSITWREDNIVAVTRSEAGAFLYFFRSGDTWNNSVLGGSEEWGRTSNEHFQVVAYDGNLYVWGALSGQIFRFTSGRFADLSEPWLGSNDGGIRIDAAIDMAIDGAIYLLQPDGTVLVYMGGAYQRSIEPPQIEPPLVAPTGFAITGNTESGYVFLLDTLNERVIQIDKQTGAFIQQIRARLDGPFRLDQLAAFFVDDTGPRTVLYLVNGGQILRANLPDIPTPFTAGVGTSDEEQVTSDE